MNKSSCPNCKQSVSKTAKFCGKCGFQLQCINCNEPIIIGNNFCEGCGNNISNGKNSSEANNTFEFSETAEGRSVKASFTDPAVKDMSQTIGNFLSNKQLSIGGSKENNNELYQDNIIDVEVEDVDTSNTIKTVKNDISGTSSLSEIPDIKNLVYRRLPKTESEWMLIYACYSTDFKLAPVTLQKIKDYYVSSGRKTDSNQNNIKHNLKSIINGLFIEYINEEEFVVTEKGFEKAREILSRTSGSTPNKKVKSGKSAENKSEKKSVKKSSSTQSLSINNKLNFHPKGKTSLREFYNGFTPKSYFEKNLIFVYYLEKILTQEERGINEVYTCYKHVSQRVPGNLYQSLIDTRKSKGWIETKDLSRVIVTTSGENAIEHDLPKEKE